jgi:integrase/recombinase XerD
LAKIDRFGQAAILDPEDWELLYNKGLKTAKQRAFFGIQRYTGARVGEVCQLLARDVGSREITFRKHTTKGKIKTRQVSIHKNLRKILKKYQPGEKWFFPGNSGNYLSPKTADLWLRQACDRVGLQGISTHSLRRTALTEMSAAGIPLRTIQQISGHSDLKTLAGYLEVSDAQKAAAIDALS